VGVVRLHADQVLLVDAGLDPDRARRVMRDLDGEGLVARALLLTHSHADHIGGAATLRRRCPLLVAAPSIEAGFIRAPSLEPFYLFGGAAAPRPLTGKFLQAEGCVVDVEVEPGPWRVHEGMAGTLRLELLDLAGHSPGQVGLAVRGACGDEGPVIYCGDAVFPDDVWHKHGFVYFADVPASLDTVTHLRALGPAVLVAGHGVADGRERVDALLTTNFEGLEAATESVAAALSGCAEGLTTEDVLTALTEHLGANVTSPTEFYLARATVQAHLARLEATGRAVMHVDRGRLLWVVGTP